MLLPQRPSNLHNLIAEIVRSLKIADTRILCDCRDCGGDQKLQLFCSEIPSRETLLCEVDALILVDNEVKVVIEIDTAIRPVQLCGKLHISTYATHFIFAS